MHVSPTAGHAVDCPSLSLEHGTVSQPDSPRDGSPEGRAVREPEARARFRRTLVRVLSMQLFTLLVLWLLQARYAH